MKAKSFGTLAVFLLLMAIFASFSWAGQVVTDTDRSWAKKALEQEKTIAPIITPDTLAVLYFHNFTKRSDLDPLEKGLTYMLITDLSKLDKIQVVERTELQALVEEMKLGVSGLVKPETAPRVGSLLGANYVVGGDILKGRITELQIDPDFLVVPSKRTFEQPTVAGDLMELVSLEKELLFDIIQRLEIDITPEQKVELEKPLSSSTPALLFLFRGIDAGDRGKYDMASDFYGKALEKDPNLDAAKNALEEVKELNAQIEKAKEVAPKQGAQAPAQPPPPEKGSSWGKTAIIGVGVAAAVGVGVLAASALSGDDDDDDDDDTPPPPPPDPDTPPTVSSTSPENGSAGVNSFLQDIIINFSEAMDSGKGDISSSSSDWDINANTNLNWTNSFQTLTLHRISSTQLSSQEEISMVFTGFEDQDGTPMDEYTYVIEIEIY